MNSIDPDGVHSDRRAARAPSPDPPILFFDGVCVLCNVFANAVLRADSEGILRLATLQGRTAGERLPAPDDDPQLWSIVYLDERAVHRESDAVLEVCRRLGGFWRLFGVARLVPRSWRDGVYRYVARRRYSWFGRKEACRVPDGPERGRFLP